MDINLGTDARSSEWFNVELEIHESKSNIHDHVLNKIDFTEKPNDFILAHTAEYWHT